MRLIELRPPRIAMALTAVAVAAHWTLHRGEPLRPFLPLTGAFTGIAGFCLMMWSWLVFRRQDLAVCPLQPTSDITVAGPYRFSRNPMYLGMVLMMFGLALFMGTPPFYTSAVVFFAVLNFVFCPYEERKLADAFGREYARYRDGVRRWV